MLFVPLVLLENEKFLNDSNDIVKALYKWTYYRLEGTPTFTGIAKAMCYGVIKSYYYANKLNYKIDKNSLERIVNSYLSEVLLVSVDKAIKEQVPSTFDPDNWNKNFN